MTTTRFRAKLLVLLALSWILAATIAIADETVILEKKSPYVTVFVSEDSDGMRILRFERFGARQSVVKVGDPDHLDLPYTQVIPVSLAFVDTPQSALVVGLGGGTIPSFLRKHYPAMRIDVVDIDPVVVEVAKSHFGFREDARMRVYVEDGRRFVEQAKTRYDLIFLDGFGTDSVPAHLTTREFLTAVRSILSARGVVVGNLWGRDVNRLYDSMVKTYRAVYDAIRIFDVVGSGNKILIAANSKNELSDNEVISRARVITERLRLRNDLAELAEQSMRRPGADGESGTLLTDADRGVTRP